MHEKPHWHLVADREWTPVHLQRGRYCIRIVYNMNSMNQFIHTCTHNSVQWPKCIHFLYERLKLSLSPLNYLLNSFLKKKTNSSTHPLSIFSSQNSNAYRIASGRIYVSSISIKSISTKGNENVIFSAPLKLNKIDYL